MKPVIAPIIIDNEPTCSGEACPQYLYYDGPRCALVDGGADRFLDDGKKHLDCFPGLRQQRDEARRELCDFAVLQGGWLSVPDKEKCRDEYAASRGWGYLYEEETP